MDSPTHPSEKRAAPFWNGLALGVLVVCSVGNVLVLIFGVPKFDEIFQDALPGKPLPPLTEVILHGRIAIAFVNLAWVIFCSVWARKQKPHAIFLTNFAIAWNIIQAVVTVIAQFMPMAGDGITGMSDSTNT